jgi:hypothetical protein
MTGNADLWLSLQSFPPAMMSIPSTGVRVETFTKLVVPFRTRYNQTLHGSSLPPTNGGTPAFLLGQWKPPATGQVNEGYTGYGICHGMEQSHRL